MRKLTMLATFAVGYVLGARAGRERYEQIMGTVDKVRQDPRVQEKTQQAVDAAKQQAPVVADKVAGAASTAASAAASKLPGSGSGSGSHEDGQPARMSLQDLP
jgi:hypothetical protein